MSLSESHFTPQNSPLSLTFLLACDIINSTTNRKWYMIKMKNSHYKLTIVLAYADRYLYPILLLVSLIFEKFLISGIACLIYAIYKLVGYICKWNHIFCSYQNAYHKKNDSKQYKLEFSKKIRCIWYTCYFRDIRYTINHCPLFLIDFYYNVTSNLSTRIYKYPVENFSSRDIFLHLLCFQSTCRPP